MNFAIKIAKKIKKARKSSSDKSKELFLLLPNGLTLLDIGAAGGIEPRWEKVCKSLNYIGVEPDKRSNQDLNATERCRKTHIIDSFAWSEETEIEFNLCRNPKSSSAYQPNRELLDQYPNPQRCDILQKVILKAEPLRKKLSLQNIDFAKLDIQGGELNALKGLGDLLNDCLGLEVEVEFSELYKSQPLFSQVNDFLLRKGFYFCDFVNLCRWERNEHNDFGRCVFGDGLWMRDLDRLNLKAEEKYLKYAAICSLYGKLDEAIHCIQMIGEAAPKAFKDILLEQSNLQKREREKFSIVRRFWSLYSPASRLHLIE